jgi:hypothetical protein
MMSTLPCCEACDIAGVDQLTPPTQEPEEKSEAREPYITKKTKQRRR